MKAIWHNCPSYLLTQTTEKSLSASCVTLRSAKQCGSISFSWLAVKPLVANILQSTVHCASTKRRSTVHQVKALWEPNQRGRIVLYFATWWSLNVVFNIYSKLVLNVFPFPWFTATIALAAGSVIMLCLWCLKIVKPPKMDSKFWWTLLPVAIAHAMGHVAATVSMSKVDVSFVHILKSSEQAFSVFASRFVLGEAFPTPVYLSPLCQLLRVAL